MLKIAICDDNHDFLVHSENLIKKWCIENNILSELYKFDNGDDFLLKNENIHIDILFLDIIMPLFNGMDLAKELRKKDKNIKIIFLTSSKEYALDSYAVKAQGYILKPVCYEKIKDILDDCIKDIKLEERYIVIKTTYGYQKLYFQDIEYVEAQNKRVYFYLKNGKMVESNAPLYSFKEKFTIEVGFFKCHRSYFVYMPNVDHFNMNQIITKSGRNIPIARGFGKNFQEAYFSYMFQDQERS